MEEKKEVTIQEIQSKLLEILLYFQKFCQENGLGFVLAGGTCLGAVRHQGIHPLGRRRGRVHAAGRL